MVDENEQEAAETAAPQQQNDAEAQLAEMRDRMLRALADAENTRRRAERERQEVSQYSIARFARDMLQIADNFGRALAACPPELRDAADPQVKAVIDGVEATERQLLGTLEQYGVKMIDTADGKFDPNRHQAIAEVPGEGKPPGSIVNVVQTGFMIGERLLRPAMVTVARKENGTVPSGIDTKV
ncbi:MAG: nucleotide exchange factor GrpE [Alphaproteobacteria bacterium]|nr:nucleotide exchange factor GrpE [Alphaproteobacteria bacterium]MDE1986886.1 nucleotide exchange factor GrpE [Alphaproteobacteria bacterium]MDE2161649.1 nucleotide exchange factor GrpE [Alphaproteobacteria bacterium]MDE2266709.1 nucleotide exchange factor GrpE [Alphaproteobacteria bacterium]MDE2500235.1 nucleotide exchange factor GrpE [Alphaproteobacteria bacterium]